MKDKLPCAVVRDLLPSYIEHLTEPETDAAVAAHLAACPDCAARHAAMAAPEETPPEADRAVAGLRTVRRRSRRKTVLLAAVCVLALALGLLAAHVFLIGSPARGFPEAELTEAGTLRVRVIDPGSATVYRGWHTQREGGVLSLTARQVLVSPLHPASENRAVQELPLEGVDAVYVLGQPVYADGTVIDGVTRLLFDLKLPYVGDPSAVSALLAALPLPDVPYTLSLQTDAAPYGLTLRFTEAADPAALEQAGALALALIGNLEVFSWTDPDGSHSLTADDFSFPIRHAAASPAALQQLRARLGA